MLTCFLLVSIYRSLFCRCVFCWDSLVIGFDCGLPAHHAWNCQGEGHDGSLAFCDASRFIKALGIFAECRLTPLIFVHRCCFSFISSSIKLKLRLAYITLTIRQSSFISSWPLQSRSAFKPWSWNMMFQRTLHYDTSQFGLFLGSDRVGRGNTGCWLPASH